MTNHAKISKLSLPAKIKLLAFLTCFKTYRDNSVIFNNEKGYKIAKRMGISPNTYNLYFNQCIELELIKKSGRNHQVIALLKVINLFFGESNQWKYIRFWRGEFEKDVTYYEMLNKIRFGIFKNNIKQQTFYTDTLNEARLAFKNGTPVGKNLLKKIQNRLGLSFSGCVHRILNNDDEFYPVSSAKHCGKLLGFSAAMGNILLNEWDKKKLLCRTIVCKPVSSKTSSLGYEYIRLKDRTLMKTLGSKVLIPM